MNYSAILEALNAASLFDLYRLREAIQMELENPARLEAIKRQCRIGQQVTYFEVGENRLIEAVILDLKRTRAVVQNLHDGQQWTIPLFFLNLEGVASDIHPHPQQVDRNTLKVGDHVCFRDKRGQEQYGKVYKLNKKTAGVIVDGTRWRVAYSLLSSVIDGAPDDTLVIEGEQQRIKFDR